MSEKSGHAGPSVSVALNIDKLSDSFEAALIAGQRPRMEDYLLQMDPQRQPALLKELLALEIEHNRRKGAEVDFAELRRRLKKTGVSRECDLELLAAVRDDQRQRLESLDTAIRELEDTGIVAPGRLKECLPPKAYPKDPEELVRELVNRNDLTLFQAQMVVAGKAKSLILGNYTILDVIGAGGMGQVFKAEHRRMDRVVALKTLPPGAVKDAAAIVRFQREVKAAAKLRHPNIVAADDADEAGGMHFLVMEYVEGQDLSALVKRQGPLPVGTALDYVLQAARGLEYAHKRGVIHRDIKPGNLLLSGEGVVKILDMGLARIQTLADQRDVPPEELTNSESIMGTIDYMSPEQARNTRQADARSDIYSLGCTLYYLLTGKRMYDGDSAMERLLAHREQAIPSLRERRDDVPEAVETIWRRMVAKNAFDRYATMTEVISALRPHCLERAEGGPEPPGDGRLKSSEVNELLASVDWSRSAEQQAAAPTIHCCHAGQAKPWLNGRQRWIALAVAALVGVGAAAGVVFELATKDGTLVVEVDEPGALIRVLNLEGKLEVTSAGGQRLVTLSLDPGKHRIRVEKEGFDIFTEEFEMQARGSATVKARLRRKSNESTPSNQPGLAMVDADRRAAQWVLGLSGSVRINDMAAPLIKDSAVLPDEKFHLVYASISTDISDAEFADYLASLTNLEYLSLVGPALTDASAASLGQMSSLKTLKVWGTGITDEGGKQLRAALPRARIFWAMEQAFALAVLQQGGSVRIEGQVEDIRDRRKLPQMVAYRIAAIDLTGTNWSDAKCQEFSAALFCSESIKFDQTQITDATVSALANQKPMLKYLSVKGTRITAAGIAALQAALPKCKIEWDGPAIKPLGWHEPAVPVVAVASALEPDRRAAMWIINMGGHVRIKGMPDEARNINNLADLPGKSFILTAATTPAGKWLTDEEFAEYLAPLSGLTFLNCRHTSLTDVSVPLLLKMNTLVTLRLWENRFSDTAGGALVAGLPECSVEWSIDHYLAKLVLAAGGAVRIEGRDEFFQAREQLPEPAYKLVAIDLSGRTWGDTSMRANIVTWNNVAALNLTNTQITDDSLDFLARRARKLRELQLRGTGVSADGVARFHEALPRCQVEWDGGIVEPVRTKK